MLSLVRRYRACACHGYLLTCTSFEGSLPLAAPKSEAPKTEAPKISAPSLPEVPSLPKPEDLPKPAAPGGIPLPGAQQVSSKALHRSPHLIHL